MSTLSPALIVGLGEVLWDRFPDGDRLGGAPANVAFHASQLGARGIVASRLGADTDGDRLAAALAANGLHLEMIQEDPAHPTGIVRVTLSNGEPSYSIEEDAAWDHLEFTQDWIALATQADAVCFGTLAQRGATSRATVQGFISAARNALRFFDVNLRQHYFDRETILFGLLHATVVKLNTAELDTVAALLGWAEKGNAACRRFLAEFPIAWLAVTHGGMGCELHSRDLAPIRSKGFPVTCIDAVGAGDAFSAALIVSLLAGLPPQEAADRANRVGSYVATQPGATPRFPASLLL